MLLFLVPPVVTAVIGVVILVIGLALLHSYIVAAIGVLGLVVGGTRWVRSGRKDGYQR